MKTRALLAALAALAVPALADTVTLAPAANTTTNALALYSGDTEVVIAGPGTVRLNPGNVHSNGTTLAAGTLELSGDIAAGLPSPVGMGTFTVAGGILRGAGTFGRDITGTGLAGIMAPGGWTWTGNNSFANTNAIIDGILEIADGATTFSKPLYITRTTDGPSGLRVTGGTVTFGERLYLGSPAPTGAGDLPASYEQTGGSVTVGDNVQLGFSDSRYGKTTFTMTGGTFNTSKNIVSGFNTTYTTNTIDVSGSAVLGCAGNFYVHYGNNNGTGNRMDINVHDGGTVGFVALYNGSTATKTNLRVDGGVLRNDKNGLGYTSFFHWIGGDSNKPLTSFTVGPKGLTFLAKNGNSSGVAQVYSPITAEPAGEGETAAGVTIASGRFAFYVAMDYEGPTLVKNGAFLYLSANGTLPAASAVTVEGGGMLRLLGTDKTIPTLTLEDSSTLGFGTPTSGANSSVLTVSETIVLPPRAKISLYKLNTPAGTSKSDNGTYVVLKVPVSYANAMRSVEWLCPSVVNGKSATFSVTTDEEYATLSVTISDATAGVYPADTHTVTNTALSVSGDIDLYGTLQLTGNGNNGSVNGSSNGGSLTIHNGGVLDASNGYIIPANVAGSSFDLYLEDGGAILVKEIKAAGTTWDSSALLHFDGGTIYPFAAMTVGDDGGGYQMLLNYQTATLGEHGLTIDLSRWVRPANMSNWGRVSIQGKIHHDPDCAGADGGIVVRGNSDEKLVLYFGGRMFPSTFNGGIRVEDGCIASSISYALVDLALTMEPGTRLRPFFSNVNAPVSVQVGTLTLGAANATKPVALDVSTKSMLGCYVVSNTVSVLSPVELGTCANWNEDIGISTGVFTTLVYKAECSIDPTLFQAPAGYALSAAEVVIAGGDYDGWKALVCTVTAGTGEIVVTGSASYPTPRTVSGDVECARVVLGGTYGGEEDPCVDTSLTISGNVRSSKALFLGYEPRPGVDQYHPHQGFLTIESGASLSVSSVYSVYRASPIDSTKNPRYGCEVTVDGGQLNVAGDVQFGYQISKSGDKLYSQLTVDNGGRVSVGGIFYLYYLQSASQTGIPGCMVLNDGEVDVTGVVDLSRNSKRNFKSGNIDYDSILYHFGLYLNGGVLKAENIKMTASASIPKIYFNGGTFMPYGKAAANRTMQNLYVAYISTNGAAVSTENLPTNATYTIAQPLLTDPALSGAADGGFTKKGAGILALTGANTFIGPVRVEKGALAAGSGALPASPFSATVADGAVLYATGADLSLTDVTASGTIVADSVSVSDALKLAAPGSILSVYGDLTIPNNAAIDFGLDEGEEVPATWIPVAAASGTVTAPTSLRASNAGVKNRCLLKTVDGVLYACPTHLGTVLILM